jgi:mRNA interferase HigB
MHVISRRALTNFWATHADAKSPLEAWFKAVSNGTFANLVELKQTFGSVDYVPIDYTKAGKRLGREFHVFNIGGNRYRLVTAIHFNTQRCFIRFVMTHSEYDRGVWRK